MACRWLRWRRSCPTTRPSRTLPPTSGRSASKALANPGTPHAGACRKRGNPQGSAPFSCLPFLLPAHAAPMVYTGAKLACFLMDRRSPATGRETMLLESGFTSLQAMQEALHAFCRDALLTDLEAEPRVACLL